MHLLSPHCKVHIPKQSAWLFLIVFLWNWQLSSHIPKQCTSEGRNGPAYITKAWLPKASTTKTIIPLACQTAELPTVQLMTSALSACPLVRAHNHPPLRRKCHCLPKLYLAVVGSLHFKVVQIDVQNNVLSAEISLSFVSTVFGGRF